MVLRRVKNKVISPLFRSAYVIRTAIRTSTHPTTEPWVSLSP